MKALFLFLRPQIRSSCTKVCSFVLSNIEAYITLYVSLKTFNIGLSAKALGQHVYEMLVSKTRLELYNEGARMKIPFQGKIILGKKPIPFSLCLTPKYLLN